MVLWKVNSNGKVIERFCDHAGCSYLGVYGMGLARHLPCSADKASKTAGTSGTWAAEHFPQHSWSFLELGDTGEIKTQSVITKQDRLASSKLRPRWLSMLFCWGWNLVWITLSTSAEVSIPSLLVKTHSDTQRNARYEGLTTGYWAWFSSLRWYTWQNLLILGPEFIGVTYSSMDKGLLIENEWVILTETWLIWGAR